LGREPRKIEIQCGVEVIDSHGHVLGTVSQVINDTYTGKLRKFVVRRNNSVDALFFSPKEVLCVTDTKINVNVGVDQQD